MYMKVENSILHELSSFSNLQLNIRTRFSLQPHFITTQICSKYVLNKPDFFDLLFISTAYGRVKCSP